MSKSRGFSLIRTVGSAALRAGGEAILKRTGLLDESQASKAATRLVAGLDELKGAAMKVGQMLSLDNSVLPENWKEPLRQLQSQSTPKPFADMQKVMDASALDFKCLDWIDPTAAAAASISQVHRGKLRTPHGQLIDVAIKIRYPNLQDHVRADLLSLEKLFRIIPSNQNENELQKNIDTVRELFKNELNFLIEKNNIEIHSQLLQAYPEFQLPQVVSALSCEEILTTHWLSGTNMATWLESTTRSAEERNRLGHQLVKLTFLEVFRFFRIQTDPNPANFLVMSDETLGLLDFGAVVEIPSSHRKPYLELFKNVLQKKYNSAMEEALQLGFVKSTDSTAARQTFYELMLQVVEPLQRDVFDWGNNDYSQKIKQLSMKFAMQTKLRPPPEAFLFANRRILGTQLFLEKLKPTVGVRGLYEEILNS